jgi:hypothetical protein
MTKILNAADFAKWEFVSLSAVAATSGQTVILRGTGRAVTEGGIPFAPIASTAVRLLIQGGGGADEYVVPTAVTPSPDNGPVDTYAFTATFANAHAAGFRIRSADFGEDEAKQAALPGTIISVNKNLTVTCSGATTSFYVLGSVSVGAIPAGAIVQMVSAKVLSAITNATGGTTWTFGHAANGVPASDADAWGATLALAAGTTVTPDDYTSGTTSIGVFGQATIPLITISAGSMTGGRVRCDLAYLIVKA